MTPMSPTALAASNSHHAQAPPSPPFSPSAAAGSATPNHFLADGLLIVDPLTRKMVIPYEHIFETRAFQRGSVPSLCMLFQSNRCRQGTMCYQVHADPAVVASLRAQIPQRAACCIHHSQQAPDFAIAPGATIKVTDVAWNGGQVPAERFAVTIGLKRSVERGEATSMCRSGSMCRFGEECRFLHLCRELEALHQPAPQLHSPHSQASYPTTPLQQFHDVGFLPETPNALGASMASLGNSFTSLPSTPLQHATRATAETSPRHEGTWSHDPYQWRCLALEGSN